MGKDIIQKYSVMYLIYSKGFRCALGYGTVCHTTYMMVFVMGVVQYCSTTVQMLLYLYFLLVDILGR